MRGFKRGIRVSGTASISLKPDLARVVLGVESKEDTVAEASDRAASAMNKMLEALRTAGVPSGDIETSHFSIKPSYQSGSDYDRWLAGFEVTNKLNVKTRDIDSVGAVIDGAVEAGGNLVKVDYINFHVGDPDQYIERLLAGAVENATRKARRLADLAGVTLGKPLSIDLLGSGADDPYPFPPVTYSSISSDTPILAGEEAIDVTVNMVFAIR